MPKMLVTVSIIEGVKEKDSRFIKKYFLKLCSQSFKTLIAKF
jgi:hypothetical protein